MRAAYAPTKRTSTTRPAVASWKLRVPRPQDMYENTWQVPGKLLSAYAEGAAVVLAGLGLMAAVLARRSAPAHQELGYGRRPGPTGRGRAPQW